MYSVLTGHEYASDNLEFACHIDNENSDAEVGTCLLYSAHCDCCDEGMSVQLGVDPGF